MKVLINKENPDIRITAPEIEICTGYRTGYYYVSSVGYCVKDRWTLVEEEPTEGIKGNLEEIPSNVDLEEEADFGVKSIRTNIIEKACDWIKSHGGFTLGFDGATVKDFLNFIKK